ncbi:MAG: histidine phosphatase family protein [Verrucomicrobia bacterium]|nr:histidine phosphatase family protein [Verrucomicrobiota bacterium]
MSTSHLPTRLFLLRHGEVEERYHRIFGGSRIDMNLSAHGHAQATKLAAWVKQHAQLDAAYVSPMIRAQQTFAPLGETTGLGLTTLDGLHEVDFGDWTGLSWEGVHAKFGISAFDWLKEMERNGFPGGESTAHLRARIEPCLQQILREQPGKSVALVCHGGIVRMLVALLLDLPLAKLGSFEVDYASVTRVDYRESKTEVRFLNLTPWRDLA